MDFVRHLNSSGTQEFSRLSHACSKDKKSINTQLDKGELHFLARHKKNNICKVECHTLERKRLQTSVLFSMCMIAHGIVSFAHGGCSISQKKNKETLPC